MKIRIEDGKVAVIESVGDSVAQRQQQHREFLAAATSDNTRRTYRSAIRHYLEWGGVLPADESMMLRYLLSYSQLLNPRTLALRLTALSQWHIQQNFPDPAATLNVRKTLLGIQRKNGQPARKAKALPVEDLALIVTALTHQGTLKALRDSALLQIAYFGAYRRSEVVRLQVEHVSWEPEGVLITLPRSKTDQKGEGITKAIPFGEQVCCPPNALRTWCRAANISSGAIFRSINKWEQIGVDALHEASLNSILTAAAVLADLPYVPQLSSHSLRRGLATSAYRAGARFQDIKRQGGWQHDGTVQGYIEEAGRFEENAAGHLLRKSK
ncbi:tyrosine-type recombinase/integrase [Glaciimonas sp. CA11.2]|uniref:tyrosine-type recombinase/integrase n=1 Tax=unclassified Glaciimonas TaxID=2644401 RepID=UPI002AB49954|nr:MULTISPECIES: tyrosine-type recombinase/integrase [unclassified Glaciimonas]MDY7548237.1 tyrosine-type recombinase/integrase [Glaciimonas sp. CA11.2]MEB0010613.1 tyrosine-type recombinase/integrase [Glaciimonas sp. Cout2]MEB0084751.1 tyrosine-type recombinase/integrase [Glaciimonas sp. Gout2]MEB0165039.1 tyrosine-type recombinase/integrase [Glaciimonas sp. CA11.2]